MYAIPVPGSKTMYAVTYLNRPTFYLDPNVQGIINQEQAKRIAAQILGLVTTLEPGLAVEKVEIDV